MDDEVTLNASDRAKELLDNIYRNNEGKRNIWEKSPYKLITLIENDDVGTFGEEYINDVCRKFGIPSDVNGKKFKNQGKGDGYILNHTVEVKTAVKGKNGSFQHELGEDPWESDFVLFIDVDDECIYITIFPNFPEETYKEKVKLYPIFPTKIVTRRKDKGAFKLDTTIPLNETNVENCSAIKITDETNYDEVAEYIKRRLQKK